MQITCPACRKTSSSKTDLSGKSVKCGCGKTFVVPPTHPAQTAALVTQPKAAMIVVSCQCGKTHRVPSTAAGRSLKCECGKSTAIPNSPVSIDASSRDSKRPATAEERLSAKIAGGSPGQLALFHGFSENDWNSLSLPTETPATPAQLEKPRKKSRSSSLLDQARKDLGESKKEVRSGASSELATSRWILIGIGALKLAIAIFYLVIIESTIEQVLEATPDVDGENLKFIIRVICGVNIGLACLFILMGVFVFMLPMTCTITAFVLFVLLEIISLVANPFALVSIRGWIIRCVMGGALLQAINNAAYFKYVKSGARDPGKAK